MRPNRVGLAWLASGVLLVVLLLSVARGLSRSERAPGLSPITTSPTPFRSQENAAHTGAMRPLKLRVINELKPQAVKSIACHIQGNQKQFAETDDDGRAEFLVSSSDCHRIIVCRNSVGSTLLWASEILPADPPQLLEIRYSALSRVQGKIIDEFGRPLPDMSLDIPLFYADPNDTIVHSVLGELYRGQQPRLMIHTDESGEFVAGPLSSEYYLGMEGVARGRGEAGWRVDTDIPRYERMPDGFHFHARSPGLFRLTLQREKLPQIMLRVLYRDGTPAVGAVVVAHVQRRIVGRMRFDDSSHRADDRGCVAVPLIVSAGESWSDFVGQGLYILAYQEEHGSSCENLIITRDMTETVIRLTEESACEELSGVVLNGDKPLANHDVVVAGLNNSMTWALKTNSEGQFVLKGLPRMPNHWPEDLRKCSYAADVLCPEGKNLLMRQQLELGSANTLQVRH